MRQASHSSPAMLGEAKDAETNEGRRHRVDTHPLRVTPALLKPRCDAVCPLPTPPGHSMPSRSDTSVVATDVCVLTTDTPGQLRLLPRHTTRSCSLSFARLELP